jgi:hypothetical protein
LTEYAANLQSALPDYQFEGSNSLNKGIDNKNIVIGLKIKIVTIDKQHELASIETQVTFYIDNIDELITIENEQVKISEVLIQFLFHNAGAITTGILSTLVKDSKILNAIFPLIGTLNI